MADLAREKRIHGLIDRVLDMPAAEVSLFLQKDCADDPSLLAEMRLLVDQEGEIDQGDVLADAIGVAISAFEESGTPKRVGPYAIRELLGEGGMGRVFRAEQEEPVRRQVALKILRFVATGETLARFQAERHAMGRLDHPNVGKLLEAGTTAEGLPYFAMELIDGEPITSYCDSHTLDLKQRLRLFVEVCRGSDHAHRKLLLHRDIKPSNILVTKIDGRAVPKLIDFGIAKGLGEALTDATLWSHDQIVGTPAYMSPEALGKGGDLDVRSDVYSLGIVLYHLLTGHRPWSDEQSTPLAALNRSGEDEISRPSRRLTNLGGDALGQVARLRGERPADLARQLRGDLDWITLKAVAHDPARRYSSAEALAADIERFLDHRPVRARAPTTGYVLRKLARRHRGRVIAAALVAGALVLGTVGTSVGYVRARGEAERANREAETARQAQRSSQRLADFMTELFKSSHPDRPNASTVTARELLDRGAERLESELEDEPRVRASLQRTIANVFLVWGLPKQAEPLLASALEVLDVPGATPGPELLLAWADWSNLSRSMGRYEEAASFAERALASPELLEDQSAEFIARLEYWAGISYLRLRRLPTSEQHFKNMLTVLDANNEDHFSLSAYAWLFLGRIRHLEGHHEESLEHYRRCLELREGRAPDRSLSTVYQAIGGTLTELHRFDEAEAALRRALELSTGVLGPDSVKVAAQLSFLGDMLIKQGRHDEAVQTFHRALAIQRRHLAADHPDIAITLTNMAQATAVSGAPHAEYAPLYREASEIFGRALPDNHPHLLSSHTDMGWMEEKGGDHTAAEVWFRRALAMLEHLDGGHSRAVSAYHGLMESLYGQGHPTKARTALAEGLAYFQSLGDEAGEDQLRQEAKRLGLERSPQDA